MAISDGLPSLLGFLSAELAALAARVLASTATVAGQNRELDRLGGSAWAWDETHLVTNQHVVDGLEVVFVEGAGARRQRAEVVGADPVTDLALLDVPFHGLPPLHVRIRPATLGELCFACGSPFLASRQAITSGIVSGVGRTIEGPAGRPIDDVIQTDAHAGPGSSGGPLVDADGQVLGVVSAGHDPSASPVTFAVPAAAVLDVVPELLDQGHVARPELGVTVAQRWVSVDGHGEHRLVVTARRHRDSPFEVGDVLLRLDGRDLRTRADLARMLRRGLLGRPVEAGVLREGRPTPVVLAFQPVR